MLCTMSTAPPPPADKPVKGVPQFPVGHLGHLTPQQLSLLDQLKSTCAEKGIYRPGQGDKWPSHDDATMLRYLRARSWQVSPAHEQFRGTETWRKENRLDQLYEEDIDIEEYEDTRKLYPQWTGRRDLRGMPVYVFEVAPLDSKVVAAYEKATTLRGHSTNDRRDSPKMLRLVSLYENLTRFVTPWCTAMSDRPHAPTPITQGNNIVDISGVGLKQFWDLKRHIQDSSALTSSQYPETLDRIFVIGAPGFFPTIWSWLKPIFDPGVVAKIFILSQADVFPTLSKFIDPSCIPKKYGGQLDWNFGEMPSIDAEMAKWVWWNDAEVQGGRPPVLPIGPIRWEEGDNGEMRMVAVGRENGTVRRKVLGTLGCKYTSVFFARADGKDHQQEKEKAGEGEAVAQANGAAVHA